ncbi:hypothetical protein V8F20_011602 [Naviculisporaceae sp. PSN 640]
MYVISERLLGAVRGMSGLTSKALTFLLLSKQGIVQKYQSIKLTSRNLKKWHFYTGVAGCFSLLFSVLAFWTSLESSRYARWTAQKDFALLCMDASTRHLSADCPKFANLSIPSPLVKDRLDRIIRATADNRTRSFGLGSGRFFGLGSGRPLDTWGSDYCTEWVLQSPALFPLDGTFIPGTSAEFTSSSFASKRSTLDLLRIQDGSLGTKLEG